MRLGNYACEAQVAGVLEYERQPALRVETWPPPGLCSESKRASTRTIRVRQVLRNQIKLVKPSAQCDKGRKTFCGESTRKIEVATTLNTMLPAP